MTESQGTPWPDEIRYISAEKRLEITFDTGETLSLPAELLRVESPFRRGSRSWPWAEDPDRRTAPRGHHGDRTGRQLRHQDQVRRPP